MVSIEFVPNKDGITTSFLVNGVTFDSEVPFVPRKLVDSRGLVLFLYCKFHKLDFDTDLVFKGETWDDQAEIRRLFNYCKNPVYVYEAIEFLEQQKEFQQPVVIKQTVRSSYN